MYIFFRERLLLSVFFLPEYLFEKIDFENKSIISLKVLFPYKNKLAAAILD